MDRLQAATRKLEAAVDRLEEAAVGGDLDGDAAELRTQLDDARRSYAELSKATNEVSAKLESTIGRLKLILDE
jgi:hypothetical protein